MRRFVVLALLWPAVAFAGAVQPNPKTPTVTTVKVVSAAPSATPTCGTCDAARRGTLCVAPGTSGVADVVQVCRKDATDTYAWLYLGGLQ